MRRCLAFLGLLACGAIGPVHQALAAETLLALTVERIEHESGALDNLQFSLVAGDEGWILRAQVDELHAPELPGPLRDLQLECPKARVDWPAVVCDQATLGLADSPWGKQQVEASFHWRSAHDWRLGFTGLRYAGDRLSGQLSMLGDSWRLRLRAQGLQVRRLGPLKPLLLDAGLSIATGVVSAVADVHGDPRGVRSLQVSGLARQVSWADEEGLQAAEKLGLRYAFDARRKQGRWDGHVDLHLQTGELYSDPMFIDLEAQPVRLQARGGWLAEKAQLSLARFTLEAGDMLGAEGKALLDLARPGIRRGAVQLRLGDLGKSYTGFLQSLLVGSPLEDVELVGAAEAELDWDAGTLSQAQLKVSGLHMADLGQRFALAGLSAELYWQAQGEPPASRLRLQGARLGKLDFGQTDMLFRTGGPYLHLLEPLQIPFCEGYIRVPDLTWLATGAGPEAGFSMTLEEVSLRAFTGALEWPLMNGTINARLPGARYAGDALRVDGDISIEAFDGLIGLRGLELEAISSAAPVLQGELALRGLDLAKVTETFSFGRIRGRLDGEVRDLQLVAWEPDRFQAHLYSPEDDDLPHKISQRAIEDLTELGNGVSGAFASPFLQIFKEFSYDRVELRVAQRGDRAEIGGIPHAGGGYYLVKGAGIPRIDVIGRNRDVAWHDLVARLRSIRVDEMAVE